MEVLRTRADCTQILYLNTTQIPLSPVPDRVLLLLPLACVSASIFALLAATRMAIKFCLLQSTPPVAHRYKLSQVLSTNQLKKPKNHMVRFITATSPLLVQFSVLVSASLL